MKREFELSEGQLAALKFVGRSLPYIVVGGVEPESPQARANREWKRLGSEMGFDYKTVLPVPSKGERFFTAEELPGAHEDRVRDELADALIEGGAKVTYHGYIEIDVRLMRLGHGREGDEYAQEQRRTIKIEEPDARWIGRGVPADDPIAVQAAERGDVAMAHVEKAVCEVLDADEFKDLHERTQVILERGVPPERLRAALEVLES